MRKFISWTMLLTIAMAGCAGNSEKKKKPTESAPDPVAEFDAACRLLGTGQLSEVPKEHASEIDPVSYFIDMVCKSPICKENHFFQNGGAMEGYLLEKKYEKYRKFLKDQGKDLRCEAVEAVVAQRRWAALSAVLECMVPVSEGVLREKPGPLPSCIRRALISSVREWPMGKRHEAMSARPSAEQRRVRPAPLGMGASGDLTAALDRTPLNLTAISDSGPLTDPPKPRFIDGRTGKPIAVLSVLSATPVAVENPLLPVQDLKVEGLCEFSMADFESKPVEPETLTLLKGECARLVRTILELAAADANACVVTRKLAERETIPTLEPQIQSHLAMLQEECARRIASGTVQDSPTAPSESEGGLLTDLSGGRFDKNALKQTINSHKTQIRRCYEIGLRRQPGLSGKVEALFTIEPTGLVSSCEVKVNLAQPIVGECICSQIKKWSFPRPGDKPVQIRFPWVFKADPSP